MSDLGPPHNAATWVLVEYVRSRLPLIITLLLGLGIAVLAVKGAGEVYESVEDRDGVASFDRPILETMKGLRTDGLNAWVTGFTNIGDILGMTLVTVVVTALLALIYRRWTPPLLIVASSLGALAMTVVGKNAIGRARPPHADAVPPYMEGFSFPSGHALYSMTLCLMLAYLVIILVRRTWVRSVAVTACVVFGLLMGLSRIYLGHHWTTDVLAAWLLAAGWVAFVIVSHRVWGVYRERREPAPANA